VNFSRSSPISLLYWQIIAYHINGLDPLRPSVLPQMGLAHRSGWRHWRAQGLSEVRHKRHREGRYREDPTEKREGRGRYRGKSFIAGWRANREATREIRGEGLQSRRSAENEQQHHGEREEGVYGGSERPGGSVCPSVLRRAQRKIGF